MSETKELIAADGSRFEARLAPPGTGTGPALLVIAADGLSPSIRDWCDRFAAEGYAVLAPDLARHFPTDGALDPAAIRDALSDIATARSALAPYLEAGAKTGAIGIGAGARLAWRMARHGMIDALVCHGIAGIAAETDDIGAIQCPVVLQAIGPDIAEHAAALARIRAALPEMPRLRLFEYAACKPHFADPLHADFDRHPAGVAHSRSLSVLRPALGPHYDFARLFQEHLYQEFTAGDPDATMDTMVPRPYVNHVPTLTGGVGHDMLKRFYKYHFIPKLPKDRETVLLSETVSGDTVVLEFINRFTHTEEIDYSLPGIKPSGKRLEIPTVVIAKFRGDKLYHEHIYWDQASLLVQLGLIDPKGLPVAGVEEARKMLDQDQPANELMARWHESEDKPI
jgi:carboxymethylenebutenolidase